MYYRANNIQRFCAYLIDLTIISLISSAIIALIFHLINYDSSILEDLIQNFQEEISNEINNDSISETLLQTIYEIVRRYIFEYAITLPIYIVLDILYLIVLPHFWKKQTLGRWFMGCKVVSKNGDLTLKRLFLRELVGTFIFYQLLSSFGVFISAILVFATDRSIVDMVSSTALVNSRIIVTKNNNYNNQYNNQYNNYNNNNNQYNNNYNNNNSYNNDFNQNNNKKYNSDDVIDAKVDDINNNDNDDTTSDDDEYTII